MEHSGFHIILIRFVLTKELQKMYYILLHHFNKYLKSYMITYLKDIL